MLCKEILNFVFAFDIAIHLGEITLFHRDFTSLCNEECQAYDRSLDDNLDNRVTHLCQSACI
jgi:hypothetical protein